MNLGKSVTFKAGGRLWTIRPFTLDVWFQFCKWLKERPRDYDPLARISKLPLEKMDKELAERLVREAIEEDKKLYDFQPESEATRRELGTVEGMIKAVSLLADESVEDTRAMVLELVREGRTDELTNAIKETIGEVEKKVAA